jgi:hypothetical protein
VETPLVAVSSSNPSSDSDTAVAAVVSETAIAAAALLASLIVSSASLSAATSLSLLVAGVPLVTADVLPATDDVPPVVTETDAEGLPVAVDKPPVSADTMALAVSIAVAGLVERNGCAMGRHGRQRAERQHRAPSSRHGVRPAPARPRRGCWACMLRDGEPRVCLGCRRLGGADTEGAGDTIRTGPLR